VIKRAAFVPAAHLSAGDHLRLAAGAEEEVISVSHEESAEGQSFTTYNLEVDEFPTYFVGTEGVWVHNECEWIQKT
jgi:hypothetical protein